jgi:hypothetical protein
MAAPEFELLGESEAEQEHGYPEFEWENSLHSRFGDGELITRRARATISPQMRAQIEKHRAANEKLMRAVAAMRKHVSVRNGGLHFTLPARSTHEAAAKLGMDHSLFSNLYNSLNARNSRFGLVATRSGQSRATISAEVESESSPSCAGVTKVETVWWGIRLWLDECKAQTLINALKGGGAIGPACVALAGPEAAPACAVLPLSAGFGFLTDAIDKSGGSQGVVLSWTWANLALPSGGVTPMVVSQSNP